MDCSVAEIVERSVKDLEKGAKEYASVRSVLLELAGNLRSFEANLHTMLGMHKNQLLTLQAQADPCKGWGFMSWLCYPIIELLSSNKDVYKMALEKLDTGAANASQQASTLATLVLEKCEYALRNKEIPVL